MLLATTIILSVLGSGSVLPLVQGLPAGAPLPPPRGDWVVRSPLLVADVRLDVHGDIRIEPGGALELRGVELVLHGRRGEPSTVAVAPAGTLHTRASGVSGRRSVLRPGSGLPWQLRAAPGSRLTLVSTDVVGAGWSPASPGIVVHGEGSEVTVIDCELRANWVGLTLEGRGAEIATSRILGSREAGVVLQSGNLTLIAVTFADQPIGVLALGSSDVRVEAGWFEGHDEALVVDGARSTIAASVLVDNGTHLRVAGGSSATRGSILVGSGRSAVEVEAGHVSLAETDIVGNAEGVRTSGGDRGPPVDARNVYWGAADGPSGAGPGGGDAIDEGVRFEPWCPSSCNRGGNDR